MVTLVFFCLPINEFEMFDCIFIFPGKLVEYDEPMKLMTREGSLFGQLVKEYWSHLQSAESY